MSALKLKKLTVIMASSFCLWNIDITSANAAQLAFTNTTNKIATDFHLKLTSGNPDVEFTEVLDASDGFGPIKIGETYIFPEDIINQYENFKFVSAEWSFAEGKNEPATLVPEPTTIFGSALALGVGGWLKRKKSSQQNKITSHH